MQTQLYILIGILLFCIGIFLFITRKNAVMAWMGIELMLNAANLNFVAFSRNDAGIHGQMAGLFVIVIAAAETAVALAIMLTAYKHFKSLSLDKVGRG